MAKHFGQRGVNMYIKRAIEEVFLKTQSEYPVTLLTGPRQVGKTTMLKKLMEGSNRRYVSLDEFDARMLAKDPAAFFQIHKPPILIDEVQYAPELFSYIKVIVDKNKTKGDFWLTGSQAYKLMQGVTESLAGRIAIMQLQSLSQAEIYGYLNQPFEIDIQKLEDRKVQKIEIPKVYENIFNGGMPDVVTKSITNIQGYYRNYIASYIERDVKYIASEIDGLKYYDFIKAVAARISQQINVADLSRDVGINEVTAKRWLGILETLGVIFFLHPYSNNVLKRALKKPKLYFYDTALAVHITGWSSPEITMNSPMNGAYFENYVISEIYKSYFNDGMVPALYYYRDKEGQEIDLILEKDGVLHPIEIKKAALATKSMIQNFDVLKAVYPYTIGKGAVICNAQNLSALNENVLIVPVAKI